MDINNKKPTRQSYGEALENLGRKNKDVVVLDADLSGATKTNMFAKSFPERFFNMGIAEQDMLATAAGFATCGKIPYASTFAVFAAGRAYDQIRNSICYPNLNVKICATHAGITVGEDGATHQMLEDIALMRCLPNMVVLSPSDEMQTKWMIEEISKNKAPTYVRLGRAATPLIYEDCSKFEIGKAIVHGDGTDATIFATGIMVGMALEAKDMLANEGISARVINIHTIKPIDEEIITLAAKETGAIVTCEEHYIMGGLGSAVCEVVCKNHPVPVEVIGTDRFGKSGTPLELFKEYGLTSENIAEKAKKVINLKK